MITRVAVSMAKSEELLAAKVMVMLTDCPTAIVAGSVGLLAMENRLVMTVLDAAAQRPRKSSR